MNRVRRKDIVSKELFTNTWLHECNRCKHKWISHKENPGTCANVKCRSPYWNKKRKY